jgi:hypothetical protein
VNGDVRLFTDSLLDEAAEVTIALREGEGGLASVREGLARTEDGSELRVGTTVVVPPDDSARTIRLRALARSRIVRVIHGPGLGFVRRALGPS